MDDSTIRAMAKWPNVPSVYGWLSLDREGFWRLRGTKIKMRRSIEYINRHYTQNPAGAWFFQNGPQQVYVDLAYTPWVFRVVGDHLATQTGHKIDMPTTVWPTSTVNKKIGPKPSPITKEDWPFNGVRVTVQAKPACCTTSA